MEKEIKVLYIAGAGRSGSTLVDRVFGQINGFCSLGELRYIWDRCLRDNQLCGCGKAFGQCEFWKSVTNMTFKDMDDMQICNIIEMRNEIDKYKNIPKMIISSKSYYASDLTMEYMKYIKHLYCAIKNVSNAKVIIDSSKLPSYAYTLNNIPCIRLYVLHLVRDSRAVAYSWLRKRVRPEVHDKISYMRVSPPYISSLAWFRINMFIDTFKLFNERYMFLKYEDFISNPSDVIRMVCMWLNEPNQDILINNKCIDLQTSHTAAGNPMRFKQGVIEIKQDDEWRHKMKWKDKIMVDALTWPLLLRYGYKF